jgi:hypothetical protein
MIADHVKEALRAATRRMVEGAPYDELTATLDAIAAMPGADELTAEIAGRRLALLEVFHRDEAERDRVMQAVMNDLSSVPLPERVRWISGAGRYEELVARYLRPLLPELQAAVDRNPDDDRAQEALWLTRRALADVETGASHDEPTDDEEPEEESASIPPWPPEVGIGLDVVRMLIVGRRSYEEVSEALDAVMDLPGGELAAGLVANERILLVNHRVQDDAEAERVLTAVAPVLATFSVRDRASAVSLACSGRPALAEKYIPPLIAELEEELRANPDMEGEATLAGIKRNLERTRTG